MPTNELLTRSAPFAPSTWNPKDRTVTATLMTSAPILRRDARGPYHEVLDLDAVDPASLAGLPILDGHKSGESRHVVGVVLRAWREGDAMLGVLQFSAAPDTEPIRTKIAEGVLQGVSVGAIVQRWEESE